MAVESPPFSAGGIFTFRIRSVRLAKREKARKFFRAFPFTGDGGNGDRSNIRKLRDNARQFRFVQREAATFDD